MKNYFKSKCISFQSGFVRCDVKTTRSTRSDEPAIAQFSSRKRQPEHYLGRAA